MPDRRSARARVVNGTSGAVAVTTVAGLSAPRCVGWLLRTNRRLTSGGNRSFRSGAEFARAFRGNADRPLAASYVTRWENGDIPASMATVRRYEQLLGRPIGSLQSVTEFLLRVYGYRPRAESLPEPEDERLEGLLDRFQQQATLTGAMWNDLTRIVATRPGMYLYPRRLWKNISEQLLRELVIAEGESWLQRQEAFSRLLEHPVAGRYATATCIEVIEDSASPVFIEPLSLLEITNRPEANRYVLRQLIAPASDRALHGALLASIRKIQDGHFLGEDWIDLATGVRGVVADPSLPPAIPPLITEVGRGLYRRGADPTTLGLPLVPAYRPDQQRAVRDDAAARQVTSARIALAAQTMLADAEQLPDADLFPDDLLARLTDEALHNSHPDKRLAAGMMIAASPYREPVARAVLTEIAARLSRREEEFCAVALRTLTNLGADCHRPLIRDILTRPGFSDLLRDAAASALPHCGGRYSVAQWREVLGLHRAAWLRQPSRLAQSILHGVTYGIGTDGYRHLLREIRFDADLPVLVRTTANWLLNADLPGRGRRHQPAGV